ncbi:MAG: hypothetical protein K8U57_26120 [Planctomycetes bacterium]|nr:hypothetical protein [Planctomycetota bacterium]
MARSFVTMALAVMLACGLSAADEDPIKEKLATAKVAYDAEMGLYRKSAGEWFDKREADARKDGNKKLVDQIKVERTTFDEIGDLPKTAPNPLRLKPILAKKTLEGAYSLAVKEYTKAKKDDKATAIEEEWQLFLRGNSIDLLALTNPKAHTVSGEWKKDGKNLISTGGKKSDRIQLQYEPGEEYDLELTCRRLTGKEGFCIGAVAGGRQVLIVVDGWPAFGYRSGFDQLDGKGGLDNATTFKGGLIKLDKTYTITCSVRSETIDVLVEGKTIIAFKGDFARLSLNEAYGVPSKKALFLHAGPNSSFQVDRITVKPVKGQGMILK